MDLFFSATVWINLLVLISAYPEIQSKGKQQRVMDAHTSGEEFGMPRFAEPIPNITVTVGHDALMACVVENLRSYKVAWVRVDTQTVLSIHHNLITQNQRITLTYNDHRSWYLHITNVTESDRGWYMCQINTNPMRSRRGYLQVVVPPAIIESQTSSDLVVREGGNITLACKAKGFPEPYVMWRREDGEEMAIGGEYVNVVDGEILHIIKVSRLHMGAYLCVASNGVPPSVSRRVNLRVQFPPMLSIPNQLEGAYVGQDITLECHTEAYPASINYWTTERGDMIISDTSRAGDKYETASKVNGYTKFMKLKIRSVSPNDFGTYRCVAKNSLGETDGNIKLDEIPAPTNGVLSDRGFLNRSLDGKRLNRNKSSQNSLPDYGVEEWRDVKGGADDPGIGDKQTPVRNPPGAFHNSAVGSHNLPAGSIIRGIQMHSVWIFKHLLNYVAAGAQRAWKEFRQSSDDARVKDDELAGMKVTMKATTKQVKEIRGLMTIQRITAKIAAEQAADEQQITVGASKTIDTDNDNSSIIGEYCASTPRYKLSAIARRCRKRRQNPNFNHILVWNIDNNRYNSSDQPFNDISVDTPTSTQTCLQRTPHFCLNPQQTLLKIFAYIRNSSDCCHKSQNNHHKQMVIIFISVAVLTLGLSMVLLFWLLSMKTCRRLSLLTNTISKRFNDRKRKAFTNASNSKTKTYLNGFTSNKMTNAVAADSKSGTLSRSR